MLWIELLKIIKRKLNYIYTMITMLVILSLVILEINYNNTDINKEEFIYNYNFKLILIMSILFVILNIIYSYRKDYVDKINKFIRFSKVTRFYNLFSKLLANYIVVFIHYIMVTGTYIITLYYISGTDVQVDSIMKNNIIISLVILFFVTNLTLLTVVIFNNAHIALSLSILLLTILTFIRDFLKNQYSINFSGDIFSDSFSKISTLDSSSSIIQLLIYAVCVFFVSLIVKLIKDN